MRMIPIRPLLVAAAGASLLLAGAPAFAQDTAPPAPPTADMPGNMAPPPADTMNKAYPLCRGGMVDNCQNPGEGGAPGRSRASDVKGGMPAQGMGMHHKMGMKHKKHHHKM